MDLGGLDDLVTLCAHYKQRAIMAEQKLNEVLPKIEELEAKIEEISKGNADEKRPVQQNSGDAVAGDAKRTSASKPGSRRKGKVQLPSGPSTGRN